MKIVAALSHAFTIHIFLKRDWSTIKQSKLDYTINKGEGAFYGPKIEFSLQDCLARVWQLGTIQLDFSMPLRLGATYVASDNSKKVPVMLHSRYRYYRLSQLLSFEILPNKVFSSWLFL